MKRPIVLLVVLAVLLALVVPVTTFAAEPVKVAPKVMVMAMFGDPNNDRLDEVDTWVKNEKLIKEVVVAGLNGPVYCNSDFTLCAFVTDMGTANAAASLMAVGLSPKLDLRKTYFLVAGCAGVDPMLGTTGSAAWANYVVDGDLSHHIDAREMPVSWAYPVIHLGCKDGSWCEGWSAGTEVFALNPTLTTWAYNLSKDTALADNDGAKEYRAKYPAHWPAAQPPKVLIGVSLASGRYWHGNLAGAWASYWVNMWTGGKGQYTMTNMEDTGTLTSLARLSKAGLIGLDRIMVLRTASNLDRQYPGQSAAESLQANSGGFGISMENAWRVGGSVVHHIRDNWEEWEAGVPALPKPNK